MISPYAVTIRRVTKSAPTRRPTIRDVSRRYFRVEQRQVALVEILIFTILAVLAAWPICRAVMLIRETLL